MTNRPVIGVTSYQDTAAWGVCRRPAALLPQVYVNALTRAGAIPVILPPQLHGAAKVLERLDSLVLAGGPDINPARYKAQPHPRTACANSAERDRWETELLLAALERDLPVLAICRGMQLLNVTLGGDLIQHLPDQTGDHSHQIAPATFTRRTVRIRRLATLGGILGPSAQVSCYHHQAVGRLGTGLQPCAWSTDETIEAVELPGKRFTLGVQWHPEADPDDLRLFEALVAASRLEASVRR